MKKRDGKLSFAASAALAAFSATSASGSALTKTADLTPKFTVADADNAKSGKEMSCSDDGCGAAVVKNPGTPAQAVAKKPVPAPTDSQTSPSNATKSQ